MTDIDQPHEPDDLDILVGTATGSSMPAPLYSPGGTVEGLVTSSSNPMRIGLWGGSLSGKTLFAGALQIAIDAAGANAKGRGLRMISVNEVTMNHMSDLNSALGGQGNLPPGTINAKDLRWVFSGKLANPQAAWGRLRYPGWLSRTVQFELDMRDGPGIDFKRDQVLPAQRPGINEAVAALAASDGIIYLFDPVSEAEGGHAADFFTDTLATLNTVSVGGERARRYLPQRLAVCMTKFDDEVVFRRAVKAGLVFSKPDGTLRVPEGRLATEFFELICKDSQANGMHLLNAIRNNFRPSSVRYFVTSAVGFSAERDGAGSGPALRRSPNVYVAGPNGMKRVREQARPINVLEPLLYLVRHGRSERARRAWRERLAADGAGP